MGNMSQVYMWPIWLRSQIRSHSSQGKEKNPKWIFEEEGLGYMRLSDHWLALSKQWLVIEGVVIQL